jgi:hypothetical protein
MSLAPGRPVVDRRDEAVAGLRRLGELLAGAVVHPIGRQRPAEVFAALEEVDLVAAGLAVFDDPDLAGLRVRAIAWMLRCP